ncbi:MAG: hypothetical protein MPJ50_15130 [Pirellulales bacterium]|nr:hypothetical protein [Pirellulales bacterium]
MPKPQVIKNPFFLLLSLVGFAFVVTVCAYWLMSLAVIRDPLEAEPRSGLLGFLESHGTSLLIWEVGSLIVLCLAAMVTDDFWTRFWQSRSEKNSINSEGAQADESHTG